MLSNTRGIGHSAVQGGRRSDATMLMALCPTLKKRGKCTAYNREQHIRHEVALAKEKELMAKATSMYTLQLDLLSSLNEETGGGSLAEAQALLRSLSSRGVFSPEPSRKAEMIRALVDELKQEPAYQHWNLEAEVAARMVQQRLRHCPYSHQEASHGVLKRERARADKLDTEAEARHWKLLRREETNEACEDEDAATATATASTARTGPPMRSKSAARARATWATERARVFQHLSPFQKCVCCLLWQRTIHVPQRVLKDVRRALEREVEARGTWPGHAPRRLSATQSASEDEDESLDAYLQSAEFDALVAKEEARVVAHVVCRPELGVVDLSSLPSLIVHAGDKAGRRLFSAETVAFFTAPDTPAADKPHPTTSGSFMNIRLTAKEVDVSHTAKADELAEVLEWMRVVFYREQILRIAEGEQTSQAQQTDFSASPSSSSSASGRFVWRSLTLRRAELTQAEPLVTALHKRGLERHLLALDLSDNRLVSLRFLFFLRAHYGQRLLRLSLKNNLITRKPEYQEQVRLSLPKLTSLDGEPVRRPPMPFPRPRPDSFTLSTSSTSSTELSKADRSVTLAGGTSVAEARTVLDCLARLCYIWETRRIPHTQAELARFTTGRAQSTTLAKGGLVESIGTTNGDDDAEQPGASRASLRHNSKVPSHVRTVGQPLAPTAAAGAEVGADTPVDTIGAMEPEQELDEDNFPHRYLHPSATYSFTATPDLALFDPETMKLNREVELDDSYQGMRLNNDDVRGVRVFDVAVRNSSRNLLHGRPALQRCARGAPNCYLAYQLTLYPENLAVNHHLDSAVISIVKVKDLRSHRETQTSGKGHRAAAAGRTFGSDSAHGAQPTFYLVTVHGLMTWRAPSMRGTEQLSAAYDRTLTFVEKVFSAQNRAWERLRSPKLVLYNDHIQLRPHPLGEPVCYTPSTFARLARLVVEFGVEACADGVELVRRVMELARTDAAEHAALDALIFGPPPALPPLTPEEEEEAEARHAKELDGKLLPRTFDNAKREAARAAVSALVARWLAQIAEQQQQQQRSSPKAHQLKGSSGPAAVFHIMSLLGRTPPDDALAADLTPVVATTAHAEGTVWGSLHAHDVPLQMVHEVVALCNTHYAALAQ